MRHDIKLRLFLALPGFIARQLMFARLKREVEAGGEPELLQLRKLLGRGDLVVDVGANLGVYAFETARLTGRVIAFEPNPVLARILRKLAIPGVEVREIAASSSSGEAELTVPVKRAGHALGTLAATDVSTSLSERTTVKTTRLDDQDLPKVSLIKIDVEGFEEEVIAGAKGLIARDRPKLLIEIVDHFNRGGIARIRETMAGHGYDGFYFAGGERRPLESFDLQRDQKYTALAAHGRRAAHYVNNFLFLPAGADVALAAAGEDR